MLAESGLLLEIYVEDDRYAVPTLQLFVANDDLRARELARKILDESAHHTGVEVRLADRRVAAVGTCAPRRSRRTPDGAATGELS